MALTSAQQQEIKRKAELGIPLVNPTPEAQKMYNTIREVKRKALAGIPLLQPDYWKNALYLNYAGVQTGGTSTGGTSTGGIGQGAPVDTGGTIGQAPSSGTVVVPGLPPLDQTPPVIVDNTNNAPMTPIGSGPNSPANRLELNTLVAVVGGFIFIRGAFKLLTKIF